MAVLRVAQLDDWIESIFASREPILVSGGFRGEYNPDDTPVQILEIEGKYAHTARILIPLEPDKQSGNAGGKYQFTETTSNWWEGWAPIFVACSLIPPVIDPVIWADLLTDTRRIRFFCDTNALCRGTVQWLLNALRYKADIITSAINDHEFATWAVRFPDMWSAKTTAHWVRCVQYRMSWRTVETPPPGVVIERLSPDQGALMMPKNIYEMEERFFAENPEQEMPVQDAPVSEKTRKSPNADMLLIELARGPIRDQPRNSRIVYLTGDRANARAATNALGANNVLYAVADSKKAKESQNKVAARGWWAPEGPLGTMLVPPTSQLLWNLLAACSFLILESKSGKWRIKPIHSVPNGVPSDFADPWLEIIQIEQPAPEIQQAPPVTDTAAEQIEEDTVSDSGAISFQNEAKFEEEGEKVAWLLPPAPIGVPVEIAASLRPLPTDFFFVLWNALSRQEPLNNDTKSKDTVKEAIKILVGLSATTMTGEPGERIEEFRTAWFANSLDWFHSELQRLPGYLATMNEMRNNPLTIFLSRQGAQVTMARALGQAARIASNPIPILGDSPVSVEQMQAAFERWLPNVHDTLGTDTLCDLAARELTITPARFELAMKRLWTTSFALRFEGRTGGSVTPGPKEKVVLLDSEGYRFQPVAPGALTFGRNGPVRFIERVK